MLRKLSLAVFYISVFTVRSSRGGFRKSPFRAASFTAPLQAADSFVGAKLGFEPALSRKTMENNRHFFDVVNQIDKEGENAPVFVVILVGIPGK